MQIRRIIVTVAAAVAFGATAPAQSAVNLTNFQGAVLGAFNGGGDTYSGHLAWTPLFDIGVKVRGEVGATLLKSALGTSFIALNYEALARVPMGLFHLEGGGGFQSWLGNGGTHPVLTVGLALGLTGIDRVFASYSRYFLPGPGVNLVKVGVGITL